MKMSEYKIAEQLAKIPAQISLMSLLLTSEKHREALFRILQQVKVPEGVASETMEHVVNSVFAMDQISFSPDDLGEEGIHHTKPLFIMAKCNGIIVARVLIDNGSSLNVCPLATLHLLGVDTANLRPSSTIVRAFDGSKRGISGEINLEVTIGPKEFTIPFQVIDIPRSFNLLLGRPWIHSAGAIPSSLHQMVKFITEGQIVTVLGEQDHAIFKDTAIPYIGEEETEGFGLQIFEEVNMVVEETQIGTFGLGYEPTPSEIQEMKRKVRKKRGEEWYDTPIESPDIRVTFPHSTHVQQSEVAAVVEPTSSSHSAPGLNNWFTIPFNSRFTSE